MKKIVPIIAVTVCIVIISAFYIFSVPNGSTIKSREKLLNDAISKSKNWNIVKEIKIDNHIISAAHSDNNKVTLAVFEPTSENKYRFKTSKNCNADEIVISGIVINNNQYDLIWFGGAQTEYAQITYTINGEKQEPLVYDTKDMEIICNPNSVKEYTISVCYYDSNGKKYE